MRTHLCMCGGQRAVCLCCICLYAHVCICTCVYMCTHSCMCGSHIYCRCSACCGGGGVCTLHGACVSDYNSIELAPLFPFTQALGRELRFQVCTANAFIPSHLCGPSYFLFFSLNMEHNILTKLRGPANALSPPSPWLPLL